jgi:hypothetical protein
VSDDGLPWGPAAVVAGLIFAALFVVAVLEVAVGPNPLSANSTLVVVAVVGAWGVYRIATSD